MRKINLQLAVLAWAALAAGGVASAAPLSEQPAVRHKVELRKLRFEITPTFEASLAAYFSHTIAGGLKIEYHLTDSLSIGAMGFFGTGFNTGLMDQIVKSLGDTPVEDTKEPTREQAREHVNTIPLHGGIGLTFTPWFGKMGLFGKGFLSYDIYFSGGFGFAQTKNKFKGDDDATICELDCENPDVTRRRSTDPRNDGPHNAGFNPGVQFGGGLHLYFGKFAALDLSLRNYMFTDNPSGLDFNADRAVTDADRRFLSHLFVGLGVAFFLPTNPRISR